MSSKLGSFLFKGGNLEERKTVNMKWTARPPLSRLETKLSLEGVYNVKINVYNLSNTL